MRFFEYLFFKYYNWQVRIGNGDMPIFASTVFIAFIIMLYTGDVLITYGFYISPNRITIPNYILAVFFVLLFLILYIVFSSNGKDKQIMEAHKEEWTGKKQLGAILFPTIAFVWLFVALYVKASINSRI